MTSLKPQGSSRSGLEHRLLCSWSSALSYNSQITTVPFLSSLSKWLVGLTHPTTQSSGSSAKTLLLLEPPASWGCVLTVFNFKVLVTQSCPALGNPMDCSPLDFLCPWNSPGKNTGVDSHSLLQGIVPTQGSNPGLLHCTQILYYLSHQGSPLTPNV